MKILLTGANGQIGTELKLLLEQNPEIEIAAMTHDQLNICDPEQINAALATTAPNIVINAAAFTSVDAAESERDIAFAVNATGPRLLAQACQQAKSILIQLSTDFVFNGEQSGRYSEDTPVNPLNVYGQSKAAGEAAVREHCGAHIILRTSWVYSPWRNNFMKTMLNLMAEGQPLRVVGDQTGSPTAAADIASTVVQLCRRLHEGLQTADETRFGTYHYCGEGVTSWFGFASRIAEVYRELTGLSPQLTAISSTDYPTAARRPGNSALKCDRIEEIFDISTVNWPTAVEREVRRYWKMQATGRST